MKKKLLIVLTLILSLSCFLLFGCGSPSETTPNNPNDNNNNNENSNTPELQEITGITFDSLTKVYDGTEYEILINGTLPSGVNVTYTNNKGTDAGTYNAKAKLTGNGYKDKTLNATLTITKAVITGITFENKTVDYNGNEHSVSINGILPKGSTVNYTCEENSAISNKAQDAGTYTIKVKVSNKNYKDLELTTKLVINKIDITGISFKDEKFDYDSMAHSLNIVGIPPQGSIITYSCKEFSDITNEAVSIGKYTITVTITNKNYNTFTATAKMTIKGEEKERHIIYQNNKLYFANALDNDYLYCKDFSLNEPVKRISFDVPYNFTIQNGTIYFRSKSLLGGAIKNITPSDSVSINASQKGEYLCSDNNGLYFAVNSLTNDSSAIFKITFNSNDEPVVTKLSSGKAKYLQCYNNFIYFADGLNGWKLSKINTNSISQNRILVRDEKINNLLATDGYLYYTVNNLLGDYIENYNISSGKYTKLTIDAGTNLTKMGNYLYYINTDFLTSFVEGDGIYRVPATPLTNNNSSGEEFVRDIKVSSLTNAGNNKLAYYRISDQMLCIQDINTKKITEILNGFVVPEYNVISTGSKTQEYNGNLYFMDLYKDKCLFTYNPSTKTTTKLTANKVSDFAIIGDTLYYNMVSFLINNDLYKVNLKTGGEPVKISTYDCNDIVSYNNKLFYVEQNAAGVRTAIHELKDDGTDTIIFDKGVNCLTLYKGYLYFTEGDTLHKMPAENYTKNKTSVLCKKDVDTFVIYNDIIYYREVLIVNKQLSSINIDGSNKKVVVKDCDPTDMIIDENCIYYYSDTMDEQLAGFYKLDLSDNNVTKLLKKTVAGTSYYGTAMTKIDNDIYFINYKLKGIGSDSHLYKLSLADKNLTKVI